MDRHQLVTIAVTAAITLVVTAALKWIGTLAKTVSTSSTTKTTVKRIFNKDIRDAALGLFGLGYCCWLLVHAMREASAITRSDILKIVLLTLSVVLFFCMFFFYIFMLYLDRFRKRVHEEERKRIEALMPK